MKPRTHSVTLGLIALLFAAPICETASAGYILVWGPNDLGDPNDPNYPLDPNWLDGNDFVAIAAGGHHSLAVRADGSAVAWSARPPWGCNQGQCDVPEGNDFVKVAGASEHSVALKANGSLAAWGSNYHGQCDVPEGNDFTEIAAGSVHSLAIRSDGSLAYWGYPLDPEPEPNQPGNPNVPVGNNFIGIAAGELHSLALRSNGQIEAWGYNWDGQINVPVGLYRKVAAGRQHSLAIRTDGSLAGWGRNDDGQCDVPSGNDFIEIVAGWYHSLAIRADGTLVAWGENLNGQCDVPDGNDFVAIAAGDEHSVGLTSGGEYILTVQTDPNILDCVTPAVGSHTYYVGQKVHINAPPCPQCPDVYRFVRWDGDVYDPNSASAFLTMDRDRAITAVYAPDQRKCGDECHPILQGDLNGDCYINFDDFALYCQQWLACTHPDCD